VDLESLKEFATQRQCEIIDALIKNGTQASAAKDLGLNIRTLERSLKRVKENFYAWLVAIPRHESPSSIYSRS